MSASLKVGCGGFSVARERYFSHLSTVEIGGAFIKTPRLATVEVWRSEAPRGFDFSIPASQIITHPAGSSGYAKVLADIPERRRAFCGHFKPTPEIEMAWESTRGMAGALACKFIVFETPASFYPDSNHLRDMYRFFKGLRRGGPALVWDPRATWEPRMAAKVCEDLGLVRAADPLAEPGRKASGLRYFRMRSAQYSDAQLKELLRSASDGPSYVYFTHRDGWAQARRFLDLRDGRLDVRAHMRQPR